MHCKFFLFSYDDRNISPFKIKSCQACIGQELSIILHVMQAAVAIGKNMYFPTGWQWFLGIAGCPAWNNLQRMCRTKNHCCLVVSTLPRCPVVHVSMQIIANWLSSCITRHKNVSQVKGISLTSSARTVCSIVQLRCFYHKWAFVHSQQPFQH